MGDAINGVTIERYALLLAKMDSIKADKEKCIRIAEAAGISRENWKTAHKGWQERMIDPADMGRTAGRFNALWRAAINNEQRGNSIESENRNPLDSSFSEET
jgi:hypothetical protein